MLEMLSTTLGFDLAVWAFALLILTGFTAGYIDAIAGGGGMIQALALLMAGIPPVSTLATNKVVSLSGTLTAVLKYARGKTINWYLVSICLLPCLIASALGSYLIRFVDSEIATWLIILCIPIALVIAFLPQKIRKEAESTNRKKAMMLITPIAFYDGFLGPGTGTYMALTANKQLGMNFLRATGFAKPLNLATNIAASAVFIADAKVIWLLAIPMALASVCGAYLGSHSAIKRGDGFIKKVMLIMLLVMLAVNLYKVIV